MTPIDKLGMGELAQRFQDIADRANDRDYQRSIMALYIERPRGQFYDDAQQAAAAITTLLAERNAAMAALHALIRDNESYVEANTGLLAERDALRKALRPFAEEAGSWHPEQADDVAIYTSKVEPPGGDVTFFTIGDLRRALAALSKTTEPNNG